jgi:hypothetical protein
MTRRGRNRLVLATIVLVALAAFLFLSEAAMTWLRVTLHGR